MCESVWIGFQVDTPYCEVFTVLSTLADSFITVTGRAGTPLPLSRACEDEVALAKLTKLGYCKQSYRVLGHCKQSYRVLGQCKQSYRVLEHCKQSYRVGTL